MEASVVSAQITGRKAFAADLAESKALPNIPKLEKLWYEMQREMTETGKTTRFKTGVPFPDLSMRCFLLITSIFLPSIIFSVFEPCGMRVAEHIFKAREKEF